MKTKTFEVGGLTFEAIRYHNPIPHWRLKIPSGEIYGAGTAGISNESVPKMKADLEYLLKRFGSEEFLRMFAPDKEIKS